MLTFNSRETFDRSVLEMQRRQSFVAQIDALISRYPDIGTQIMRENELSKKQGEYWTDIITHDIFNPAKEIGLLIDTQRRIVQEFNEASRSYNEAMKDTESDHPFEEWMDDLVAKHVVSIAWMYCYVTQLKEFLATFEKKLGIKRISPSLVATIMHLDNSISAIHLLLQNQAVKFSLPFIAGSVDTPLQDFFNDNFFASNQMLPHLQLLRAIARSKYHFERRIVTHHVPENEPNKELKSKFLINLVFALEFMNADDREMQRLVYSQAEAWGIKRKSVDAVLKWLDAYSATYKKNRQILYQATLSGRNEKIEEQAEYLRLVCATEDDDSLYPSLLPLLGISSAADMWQVARIIAAPRAQMVLEAEGKTQSDVLEMLIALQSEFDDSNEFPGHDEVFAETLVLAHTQLELAAESPADFVDEQVIPRIVRLVNTVPKMLPLEVETLSPFFAEELTQIVLEKGSNSFCIRCVFEEFELEINFSSFKLDAQVDWSCIYPFSAVSFEYKFPLYAFLAAVVPVIEKANNQHMQSKKFKLPTLLSSVSKKGERRQAQHKHVKKIQPSTAEIAVSKAKTESSVRIVVDSGFSKLTDFATMHRNIDINILRRKLKTLIPRKLEKLADTYKGLTCFRAWLDRRIRVVLAESPESSAGERHFEIIQVELRDSVYEKFRRLAD